MGFAARERVGIAGADDEFLALVPDEERQFAGDDVADLLGFLLSLRGNAQ